MGNITSPLILAADDSEGDRDILSRILEREGYQVAMATAGSEALEMAVHQQPDLILLDVVMPDMDGIEVCRRLQSDPATQGIPLIFLTCQANSDDILAGFDVGAVDYVTKPFRVSELVARVAVHIKLRRAQMEIHTLHGLLPTCASCKKIRDEDGAWQAIEVYISQRSAASFSHGLCPDCIPVYFPGFVQGTGALE